MKTNRTEIKTPITGWISAHRMPNHPDIFDAVCAIAGEGDPVTAEQVGKTPRDFSYDEIMLVVLKGSEILYSLNREDGAIDVEYIGVWSKPDVRWGHTA